MKLRSSKIITFPSKSYKPKNIVVQTHVSGQKINLKRVIFIGCLITYIYFYYYRYFYRDTEIVEIVEDNKKINWSKIFADSY